MSDHAVIDYDHWERRILATAAAMPDMPLSVLRLMVHWGCCSSSERMERTGRADPWDYWKNPTVGEAAQSIIRMEKLVASSLTTFMRLAVRHHEDGHRFDVDAAAGLLSDFARLHRRNLVDIPMNPRFFELVSENMGRRQKQGRWLRLFSGKDSYLFRLHLKNEFDERRSAGEKYEALIAEYEKTTGRSARTIDGIRNRRK